jgi:hypothetical protein
MTDLREQLERMAGRGEPRGADAVVRAAAQAAVQPAVHERRNGSGGGSGQGVAIAALDDEAPFDEGTGRRSRSRAQLRRAIAVVGLAALVGVVFVAVTAIGSGGGASSPEGAVRALAKAISGEDPLAAVAVLSPDEVGTLRQTVSAAERRAAEIKLVRRAGAPLAGIDLRVDRLTLTSEPLANGYVKVHLTGGTLSAATHRKEFTPLLQQLTSHSSTSSSSCSGSSLSPTTTCSTDAPAPARDVHAQVKFAEARPFDTDPFVVVVRHNGHWYVSAAYTALEYMRIADGLPAADLGSASAASLGAATPEDAARDMVNAVAARRWNEAFALVPPTQLPLYDYRAALAQLLNEHAQPLHVTSLTAQATVNGDHATVAVRASGTYKTDGITENWGVGDACAYNDAMSWCLSPSAPLLFGAYPSETSRPTQVQAVRIAGRWFISPIDTVTNVLDAWVGEFDRASVLAVVGDYAEIPPSGSLVLGREVQATSLGGRIGPRVYTFEGTAGQRVIGTSPLVSGNYIGIGGTIYDPNGHGVGASVFDGEVATLPVTGQYKLLVVTVRPGPLRFTLWDAKHAPANSFTAGAESCVRTANAVTCGVQPSGAIQAPAAGSESRVSTATTATTAARP